MQLTKVPYVSQFVSDQDKALDFYTRVLGCEKRLDNLSHRLRIPTLTVCS